MEAFRQQSWQKGRASGNSEDLFLTDCLTARAVGLWAASLLGLDGDQAAAYAYQLVVEFVRPGSVDIVQKLQADFRVKGVKVSDHRITVVADRQREAARRQVSLRIWSKKPGDGGWERRVYPRVVVPPMIVPPALGRWLERHKRAGTLDMADLPLIAGRG